MDKFFTCTLAGTGIDRGIGWGSRHSHGHGKGVHIRAKSAAKKAAKVATEKAGQKLDEKAAEKGSNMIQKRLRNNSIPSEASTAKLKQILENKVPRGPHLRTR